MEIEPLFNHEVIDPTELEVRVNPEDRKRAWVLVGRTAEEVKAVIDDETFAVARQAASDLKRMLDDIEFGRKAIKQPFDAVGARINELAKDVAGPVKGEQKRILALLETYVTQLELARKQKELLEAEARRIADEEARRKVKEAKNAKEREQAQLALELAADVESLGQNDEAPRGLVPGGRVNHVYEFELVDPVVVFESGRHRLLKCTLDILACRDAVKRQLEAYPDSEPTLPGIKITKKLNVSVKAASAARIK
jgi:hypothetical protein